MIMKLDSDEFLLTEYTDNNIKDLINLLSNMIILLMKMNNRYYKIDISTLLFNGYSDLILKTIKFLRNQEINLILKLC